MVADGEHDPEFDLIVESTGLDLEQVDSLKKGFEGFDKEGAGTISQTTMQVSRRPIATLWSEHIDYLDIEEGHYLDCYQSFVSISYGKNQKDLVLICGWRTKW